MLIDLVSVPLDEVLAAEAIRTITMRTVVMRITMRMVIAVILVMKPGGSRIQSVSEQDLRE